MIYRIIILVSMLVLGSYYAAAQSKVTQYLTGTGTKGLVRDQLQVDSLMFLPLRTDTTFVPSRPGAIVHRTADQLLYHYNGTRWNVIGSGSGSVSSVAGGYGILGGTITSTGTLSADSSALATRARLQKSIDSIAALLGATYTFQDGVYNTAGVVKADSALLSTRARLKKSIDSLAALMGIRYVANHTGSNNVLVTYSGDTAKVKQSAEGYGMNITASSTTLTYDADSVALSTRAWRQKLADSLGAIIVGNFPYGYVYNGKTGSLDTLVVWTNDTTMVVKTPVPGWGVAHDGSNTADTTWGFMADSFYVASVAKLYQVADSIAAAGGGTTIYTGDGSLNSDRTIDLDGKYLAIRDNSRNSFFLTATPSVNIGDASYFDTYVIYDSSFLIQSGNGFQAETFGSKGSVYSDYNTTYSARLDVVSGYTNEVPLYDSTGSFAIFRFSENPKVLFYSTLGNSNIFPFTASTTDTVLYHNLITGQIERRLASGGGGGGITTLAAIGSSPNANGATISGSTLNLEPASASFGGVITTGTQTFAGAKTFNSDITIGAITAGYGGGAGNTNTVFGYQAFNSNAAAGSEYNIAIGYQALANSNNATADYNYAIGEQTLFSVTTGNRNLAFGYKAGNKITTGTNNIAIGLGAIGGPTGNTTGTYNIGIGTAALEKVEAGSYNMAIGASSLSFNVSGNRNTAVGYNAGFFSTGDSSVYLGFQAGYNNTSSASLFIDNTNSSTPLIHGDFRSDTLRVNGGLSVRDRFQANRGTNVASANDLTLGTGNVFVISGTTQINAITTANWYPGAEVTLIFASTPTVKNNTAGGAGTAVILLAGGVDFSATANDVLKLVYDGTSWLETGRSVN